MPQFELARGSTFIPNSGIASKPMSASVLILISTLCLLPRLGWSFDPVLPTATIPDLSSYVAQTTPDSLIKTVGFCMDHKPYEPATGLGNSFDFGVEATVVQPPNDLAAALRSLAATASGGSSDSGASAASSTTLPFVPSLRVHLRRGFGERLDIGVSSLYIPSTIPYAGNSLWLGGDIKYMIYKQEEGVNVAVRASYNSNNLILQYTGYALSLKTVTITPQFIVSRKIGFADPYLGIGYHYTYGTVRATVPSPPITLLPGVSIAPVSLSLDGRGTDLFFFGGISLLSIIRLRLTLEGGYNPSGGNYMGTKLGFTL